MLFHNIYYLMTLKRTGIFFTTGNSRRYSIQHILFYVPGSLQVITSHKSFYSTTTTTAVTSADHSHIQKQ